MLCLVDLCRVAGILEVLRRDREVHGYLDLKIHTQECGPESEDGPPDTIYERGVAEKNVKDGSVTKQKYVSVFMAKCGVTSKNSVLFRLG